LANNKTNLSNSITIGIEEAKGIIGTRVHSEADLGNIVISVWSGLGATNRASVVGVADSKLVVICRIWFHILGFNLGGVGTIICFMHAWCANTYLHRVVNI
jgi:hypothetical protein